MIILPKNIFSLKDWKNANILNNFLVWYLDFEREKEFSKSLLAERRKAYEECARIAEEAVKTYASSYRGVGLDIANEIRRRMEGV